jgi:hypothetical protein
MYISVAIIGTAGAGAAAAADDTGGGCGLPHTHNTELAAVKRALLTAALVAEVSTGCFQQHFQ